MTRCFELCLTVPTTSLPISGVVCQSRQEAKRSGDYTKYEAARTLARAAIRRHRRNVESRLIHNNDRKAFFSYINRKKKSQDSQICLIINDTAVTDHEAVEALNF